MINLNDVAVDLVDKFGNDMHPIYDKHNHIKNYEVHNWVQYKGSNDRIEVSGNIGQIKGLFENFNSNKNVHTWEKKGKLRKTITWDCTILKEGILQIRNREIYKEICEAVSNHHLFEWNGTYYYIIDNFFRKVDNINYIFFDVEEMQLVDTGFTIYNCNNQKELLDWKQKYLEEF